MYIFSQINPFSKAWLNFYFFQNHYRWLLGLSSVVPLYTKISLSPEIVLMMSFWSFFSSTFLMVTFFSMPNKRVYVRSPELISIPHRLQCIISGTSLFRFWCYQTTCWERVLTGPTVQWILWMIHAMTRSSKILDWIGILAVINKIDAVVAS